MTAPNEPVLDRALELAETICDYSPFGVVMTKEVMWSNLDAPSFEAAIHLENRTQILAVHRWRGDGSGRRLHGETSAQLVDGCGPLTRLSEPRARSALGERRRRVETELRERAR